MVGMPSVGAILPIGTVWSMLKQLAAPLHLHHSNCGWSEPSRINSDCSLAQNNIVCMKQQLAQPSNTAEKCCGGAVFAMAVTPSQDELLLTGGQRGAE